MKEYIKQFYNEGLASLFYVKPLNYISRKVKNKRIINVLGIFTKVLYTLLALTFAGYILYTKLK